MAPLGDVTNQTVVLRTFFSEDGLQTTVTIEHPDRLSMRDVRKLAATALNDKLEPMGRGRPVQPNNSTLLPRERSPACPLPAWDGADQLLSTSAQPDFQGVGVDHEGAGRICRPTAPERGFLDR